MFLEQGRFSTYKSYGKYQEEKIKRSNSIKGKKNSCVESKKIKILGVYLQ